MATPPGTAKLYIDVNAVKHNYNAIKNAVGDGVVVMPMVKANAYGCGIDIVAELFRDCPYLAVADVKEAAILRGIMRDSDILLIYQPLPRDIPEIVTQGYTAAVSDISFAEKLDKEAAKHNKTCRVHIETDTGSGRLGVKTDDCAGFAEKIKTLKNIEVEGIFTHYCCAESASVSDAEFTRRQTGLFQKAFTDIESVTGRVRYRHAAASAAIFNPNAAHFDMVRPGYMLYGYYPDPALHGKVALKPALKLSSYIIQINERGENTPISYNRRYYTTRKSRIATVSIGYSDGLSRRLYNPANSENGCFAVNGQRAPVVGTVCMDLTMIDITDIDGEVNVGDEVFVFDNSVVTVDEIAELCGTIGYEIISQIEDKADRVAINS